jgi:hypothetical protein
VHGGTSLTTDQAGPGGPHTRPALPGRHHPTHITRTLQRIAAYRSRILPIIAAATSTNRLDVHLGDYPRVTGPLREPGCLAVRSSHKSHAPEVAQRTRLKTHDGQIGGSPHVCDHEGTSVFPVPTPSQETSTGNL